MILITGGAGFIGSTAYRVSLSTRDTANHRHRTGWKASGKWRNLAAHPPAQLIAPDELDDFLDGHPPLEAIFHMAAISDTMATDGDAVWRTNVALSQKLWHWCANRGVRFIYASSAATYGEWTGPGSMTTPPALGPPRATEPVWLVEARVRPLGAGHVAPGRAAAAAMGRAEIL